MKDPKVILQSQIDASSLRKTAKNIGVSAPYLSDVMRGARGLGPKILAGLGLEKVGERYRKIRSPG